MLINSFKKKDNDKSFYHLNVYSINKHLKIYNNELNKIINFYHKEKEQTIFNKETNQRNNKGFILKFNSPLKFTKYIEDISKTKILSKVFLIYQLNINIINEIKILINSVNLNKSYCFYLLKLIGNKNEENDTNALINKKFKNLDMIHINENNIDKITQNMVLIYPIKYIFSYIITSYFFLNEIKNIQDFHNKYNKKKFSNLEVSKNNLNFSLDKKNNKLFEIEKFEFTIYNKNIKFPELIKIKPKGIINRNGCCYLNAAIQCFYHCPKIASFFMLNREIIHKKGGPISLGYLEIVEEFFKNENKYISIKNFRKLLIENEENFNGNDGNDSKDVILLLLYSIQNELGGEELDINLDIDDTQEYLLFQDLIKNNKIINSIIIENFGFIEKKVNKCLICGEEYFNLTNQYFITFNLKNIHDFYKRKKGQAITIEECFTFNCFEEDDSEIKCLKCNKLQNALTTISFATVPNYLFIILDRGINEEFNCNFNFTEQINLIDIYYPVRGEKREENLKYSLLAGTILHGDHGTGHTFSFAKHFDGNLYIFNDINVKKTTFNDIKNEKVYLLFYERLSNI